MEDSKVKQNQYFLGSWFDQGKESFSYFHLHPIASVNGLEDSPFAMNLVQASSQLDPYDGMSIPGEEGFYTFLPLLSSDLSEESLTPEIQLKNTIQERLVHSLTMNHGFDAAVKQSGLFHKLPIVLSPTLHHLEPILDASIHSQNQKTKSLPNLLYLGSKCHLGSLLDPDKGLEILGRLVLHRQIPLIQIGTRSWSTFDLLTQSQGRVGSISARQLMTAHDRVHIEGLIESTCRAYFPTYQANNSNTILVLDGDVLDSSLFTRDSQSQANLLPGGVSYYRLLDILEIVTQKLRISSVVITCSCIPCSPYQQHSQDSLLMADLTHKLLGFLSRSGQNNPELKLQDQESSTTNALFTQAWGNQ